MNYKIEIHNGDPMTLTPKAIFIRMSVATPGRGIGTHDEHGIEIQEVNFEGTAESLRERVVLFLKALDELAEKEIIEKKLFDARPTL
jgi:hypothetical protein